jgi:putative transposase
MPWAAANYVQAQALRQTQQETLNAAFDATPNRFKGVRPCLKPMPTAAWINPPPENLKTTETLQPRTVNL